MATSIIFNGKSTNIPGVYSTIESGIKNPALDQEYGNLLIIDTGSSRGKGGQFGGGAGINGTLTSGKSSMYTFDDSKSFQKFIGGGLWWFLADPLFAPGGGATGGVSSLTYVRAESTEPAEIVLVFGATDDSDSDLDSSNDGEVVVQVRQEGYAGNAVMGDEARATATITVSNVGSVGDSIALLVDGQPIAEHTTKTGENVAAVVAALAQSIEYIGLAGLVSQNATQIVISAPRGYADELNGLPATIQLSGTASASSGNFSGGVEGTVLTRGYAAVVTNGTSNTSKYKVQFYRGTFKGTNDAISLTNITPYNNLAELLCKPELLIESPEITTVTELVAWMNDTAGKGYKFNLWFKLKNSTIASTDEILPQDLTGYVKATGGSESSDIDDLNKVLDSIGDQFYDFILADKWGDEARSTENIAIFNWIVTQAKIKPDMYVAAGSTEGEFAGLTINVANAYDNQAITIVHGGPKKLDVNGISFKEFESIYKAAAALGREAGLEPQIPLTFKNLGIEGEVHVLTDSEIQLGLTEGILMSRPDAGGFEVIKGVNSLQLNDHLVNPDASTHSKQLSRIERQLNKEIVINAKRDLLKKPNGVNRNTLKPEDVKAWLEGYLTGKIATDQDDDLILSFRAVTVTVEGDVYNVTYAFQPNFEVSFLVFTGVMIDPSI